MNLVKLEEQEYPVEKATVESVQEFITNELKDMYDLMKDKKIAFLHCIQVGINKDIWLWRRHHKLPVLVINSQFMVKNKKFIREGNEVCFSYPKGTDTFRIFTTKRANKILGIFDEYTAEGTLKRNNDEFLGFEAVAFQQMCDLSKGKLITRFNEVILDNETATEEEEVEGSFTETKEVI